MKTPSLAEFLEDLYGNAQSGGVAMTKMRELMKSGNDVPKSMRRGNGTKENVFVTGDGEIEHVRTKGVGMVEPPPASIRINMDPKNSRRTFFWVPNLLLKVPLAPLLLQ